MGGSVLGRNACRDAPPLANRDALVLRPRPDVAAALAASRGTRRSARLRSRHAGMVEEGRHLRAEPRGVLVAQVNFVLRAAYPEPQRLLGRTAIKIVF